MKKFILKQEEMMAMELDYRVDIKEVLKRKLIEEGFDPKREIIKTYNFLDNSYVFMQNEEGE